MLAKKSSRRPVPKNEFLSLPISPKTANTALQKYSAGIARGALVTSLHAAIVIIVSERRKGELKKKNGRLLTSLNYPGSNSPRAHSNGVGGIISTLRYKSDNNL